MAEAPFDCEPFEPDHDLVVKLAEYLSTVPRGQADMVNAYGILIHLYDLGIELPTTHIDGCQEAGS